MLEKTLRTPYQYLFVNWAASYLKDKIHPISVTCFSIIFGIISAICISFNFSMIAIILLLISGYCDTLDGTIARMAKKQSDIGSVLDIMADRVVEISIILGLYFYSSEIRATSSLFMLSSIILCLCAFLVVGIFTSKEHANNKSFFYSQGLMERAETFIFFILMILIPNYFNFLAYLFSVLVFITAILHIYRFIKWQLI